MSRGRTLLYSILTAVLCVSVGGHSAYAQTDSLVLAGDALREAYHFEESLVLYDQAFEMASVQGDTVAMNVAAERIILAENGRNMSRFVQKPQVIAKRRFSLDDFFLYYPLENRSWRNIPNQLDSASAGGPVRALYAPEWNDVIYFSTRDKQGVRNIYMTEQQDTVWSAPVPVEMLSTAGYDEIYPMFSPDGGTLFFSSKGFYGAGGYDLYRSSWNPVEQKWSVPQNMGFPYSSPADDFLYVESEDGQYSVFASNRECSSDSVYVYVLQYEDYPVHVSMEDPQELLTLSRLDPPVQESVQAEAQDIPHNELTIRYMSKMEEIRSLRDSISATNASLDALRTEFAFSNDPEQRLRLTDRILALEMGIPALQRRLEAANADMYVIEMDFLKEGVFINPVIDEEDDEVAQERPEYEFVKHQMGDSLGIKVLKPEIVFDYSFQILDEAQFAEDQTIPSGIVYQIQLFSGGRKALLSELKGLSPVYEHKTPGGMYTYRVGCFGSYEEVLGCVDRVRRLGFRDAYIMAHLDGEIVPVATARAAEAKLNNEILMYEVRIVPESGELDRSVVEGVVTMALGKDIARIEAEDGTQVFIVGPFDDKAQAEAVVEFVKSQGVGNVFCELRGNELIL